MNNDLANKYYNKLLEYSSFYRKKRSVTKNKDYIISIFEELINNNNQHLLTNSLLNYLCSSTIFIMHLDTLSSSELLDQIYVLSNYYRAIVIDILNKKNNMYVILQGDDTKSATKTAASYIKDINYDLNYKYIDNKLLLKRIIYLILSYCHINNKMNECTMLLNKTLNDYSLIIDDLNLNGIEQLDDILTNRIMELLGNKNKIMIK